MKTLSELQTQLSTRRIDRREFMRGVSALGLGCRVDGHAARRTQAGSRPRPRGVVSLSWERMLEAPVTPSMRLSSLTRPTSCVACRCMIAWYTSGPTWCREGTCGRFRAKWPRRMNGHSNFARGVTFHNGKPFTRADVIYTFNRLLDPAVGSGIRETLTQIDMASTKVRRRFISSALSSSRRMPTSLRSSTTFICRSSPMARPTSTRGSAPGRSSSNPSNPA